MKKRVWISIVSVVALAFIVVAAILIINGIKLKNSETADMYEEIPEGVIISLEIEFSDGSRESWTTGDEKINAGGRTVSYIYLGKYPQSEVKGELRNIILNMEYDENSICTYDGKEYFRLKIEDIYSESAFWSFKTEAYFEVEPIPWRVLAVNNGVALCLSEYGLDCRSFMADGSDNRWENSDVRVWLNDEFKNRAFTEEEQYLLINLKLENETNTHGKTNKKCNATYDKLFLLTEQDVSNPNYGFNFNPDANDKARECRISRYAYANGVWKKSIGCFDYINIWENPADSRDIMIVDNWWLRSQAGDQKLASYVNNVGRKSEIGVDNDSIAVRPAIMINLSEVIVFLE